MILQSLQFILFCVRKMILYQIVVRIWKRRFLLRTFYTSLTRRTWWLMQILIVAIRSSLKLLQKSDRSSENGITFPDPVKNPNAFPATINIPVLLMSSMALISFWTRTICGTWFQQLLCHSATLMIHTLCSISTLNQQLNNLKQTRIRRSLHYERWTVKGTDCASTLHSSKEITYRTDEWTKQLLRLKSWVISGSREQWMELHRLWWTVIVIKCIFLFHLFDFCCLVGALFVVFLEKLPFLLPFFDDFEWAVKIHRHFLCKVTLL